jgi:L-seryl-tRNA(Ser) seleniumtransferase
VINGTGVILNTNLGRAPLPKRIAEELAQTLAGYCALEIDLDSGKRGERTSAVEEILSLLTGCESAVMVNNNAAAVMLTVAALSKDKEVIVSRGELIEIGGSFRLPDVIVAAGGVLREVGTTNRTRSEDYAQAINDKSGMLLKCHRSNFEISGFTEEADLKDLSKIAKLRQIPLVEDLGSGTLLDLSDLGVNHELTVQEALARNADVVMFSGDKLLGATQAGIIIGKKTYLEILRKHPMYRALRLDKLSIAILQNVLIEYMHSDFKLNLPIYRMADWSIAELRERGHKCASLLAKKLTKLSIDIVPTKATFGGGAIPSSELPSVGISIGIAYDAQCKTTVNSSANAIATLLRKNQPPILSVISNEQVTIDLRTVDPLDDEELVRAILAVDQELCD